MAIFTFLGEGNYTVEGVIRYIRGFINKSGETDNVLYYDGLYLNPEFAARDMLLHKQLCSKEGGSQYKHYVLSLEENELPDNLDYGTIEGNSQWSVFPKVAWAIQKLTQCQIVYAVHTNTDNVHMHIVINSVRLDNYQKLNIDYQLFITMLHTCDDLLDCYGLSKIRGLRFFDQNGCDHMISTECISKRWWDHCPIDNCYLIPQA